MSAPRAFRLQNRLVFECPACGSCHQVGVEPAALPHREPVWEWNGRLDRPTISPSIRVRWNDWSKGGREVVCHSFVRDGRIVFCADSTHELAGKTVDIPETDCHEATSGEATSGGGTR